MRTLLANPGLYTPYMCVSSPENATGTFVDCAGASGEKTARRPPHLGHSDPTEATEEPEKMEAPAGGTGASVWVSRCRGRGREPETATPKSAA